MPGKIAITTANMRDERNLVAEELKDAGFELAIHPSLVPPTPDELQALLDGAVGVIAGSDVFSREVLSQAKDLRCLSRHGIGYDAIDLDAAADLGIVVTYVPDAMVDAVADLAMGLLLALARRIPEFNAAVHQGEWPRLMAHDVAGKTLGVIGTGRIGMAAGRRARGFGMKFVGYDPTPNPLFVEELGGDYMPLEELLAVSDYVTLHVPSLPQTRGLMNAAAFAKMKPGAFLINTARGAIVDEAAALDALDSGRLGGLGTDVLSSEPPLPGSDAEKLARHPKVVITPHVASSTPVTTAKMGRVSLENLLAVLRGDRPAHVANPRVYDGPLRS
jgi:D-3-phosphoglycerate dehydrogenase